jgi:RNA polymerase sigma factor (sigma-70 family)
VQQLLTLARLWGVGTNGRRTLTGIERSPDVADFAAAQGDALLRFAYLLTGGDDAEAEDLVYAVLARLVERGLQGLADPGAYARTSVVNAHRSALRRRSVQRRALPRLQVAAESGTSGSDDRLTLFSALDDLSDRERAVIVLRYYEDLDDQSIADILRCPRTTVRSLAHRAMPKLRARLAETYRADGAPDEE